MTNNLDAIKAAASACTFVETFSGQVVPWDAEGVTDMHMQADEVVEAVAVVLNTAPAIIAEIERLRQENADYQIAFGQQATRIAGLYVKLATAKKIGAAEELDALYYQVENLGHWEVQALLEKRAAELRAEVGGVSKPLHAYGSNNLCEGVALIANAVGDGPFKQFLRRVAAADQVPSCEGCKYAESWHLEGWIQCTLQFERDAPIAAEISGGAPIIVKPSYGCFEWEPKA